MPASVLREAPFQLLDLRFEFGDPLILLLALLPPLITYALLEGHGALQNLLVLGSDPVFLLLALPVLAFLSLSFIAISSYPSTTKLTVSGWRSTGEP